MTLEFREVSERLERYLDYTQNSRIAQPVGESSATRTLTLASRISPYSYPSRKKLNGGFSTARVLLGCENPRFPWGIGLQGKGGLVCLRSAR